MLLQRLYAPILNFTYKYTQRIDEKWRNIIIEACLHLFALMSVVYASAPESEPRSALGVLLLAVIIVMSVNRPLERIKANLPASIAWIVFSAAMIFSFFDPVSRNSLACISLLIVPFGLPAFYYVWGNRGDYSTFTMFLCRAFANVITVYDIALIFIAPYTPVNKNLESVRYLGTTTHSNYLGLLMLSGFISCLYVILHCRDWKLAVPYVIGLGFCTAYTYFTVSRTTLFALLLCLFCAVLYYILRCRKPVDISRIAAVFLVCALAFVAAYKYTDYAGSTAAQSAPAETAAVSGSAVVSDSAVVSPSVVPAPTPAPSVNDTIFLRLKYISLSPEMLDYVLSNRPSVWRAYLMHIGIRPEYADRATLYHDMGIGYYPVNAHNDFIYSAYLYGAFAGIGEALIMLTAVIYSAIYMFRRKRSDPGTFFCMLVSCAFFMSAVMECVGLPLNRAIVVLFYFSLAPVFSEKPAVSPLEPERILRRKAGR